MVVGGFAGFFFPGAEAGETEGVGPVQVLGLLFRCEGVGDAGGTLGGHCLWIIKLDGRYVLGKFSVTCVDRECV